jgi:hypothetical protein
LSENYSLSNREIATILCALRLHQEDFDWDFVKSLQWFEDTTPLDEKEIDTLCEKLNLGELEIVLKLTLTGEDKHDAIKSIQGYVGVLNNIKNITIKVSEERLC